MSNTKILNPGDAFEYTNQDRTTKIIEYKIEDLKLSIQLAPGCKFKIEKGTKVHHG